MQLLDMDNF